MSFNNPVVGGNGALIIGSIHSPDFLAGSLGWSINKDGSAEFNNAEFRGTVEIGVAPGTIVRIRQNGNDGLVEFIPKSLIFPGITASVGATAFNVGTNTENSSIQIEGPSEASPHDDSITATLFSQNKDGSSRPAFIIRHRPGIGALTDLIAATLDGTTIAPALTVAGSLTASRVDVAGLPSADPSTPAVAETWHAIPLTNGWTNRAASVNAQYRLVGSPPRTVEVIGRIVHAALSGSSVISTALPIGYRPAILQDFPVAVYSNSVTPLQSPVLTLDPTGVLTFFNLPTNTGNVGFHQFYSLDA